MTGVITEVAEEVGEQREYFGSESWPFPITVVSLAIEEVLKGAYDGATLAFVAPGGYPSGILVLEDRFVNMEGRTYDYEVGQEILVALDHSLTAKAADYVVVKDDGRFERDATGVWRNQATDDLVPGERIREITDQASPGAMRNVADLVIIGVVEDIVTDNFANTPGEFRRVSVKVMSSLKGSFHEDLVEFRTGKRGGQHLNWVVPVPDLAVGDEVLVFLQRDHDGYFAFAGKNGLLHVSGELLEYGDAIPYRLSLSEMMRIVRSKD